MTLAIARSGTRIDLSAPRVEQIFARDIAEHLAKQTMYDGGTWGFYSKAQHSILVATEVARGEGAVPALYALLHHAGEAFGGSSAKLLRHTHLAFDLPGLPQSAWQAIARAHDSVTLSEHRQLLTNVDAEVAAMEARGVKPLRGMIKPLAWDRAMDRFVDALRVFAVAAQMPSLPVWGNIL